MTGCARTGRLGTGRLGTGCLGTGCFGTGRFGTGHQPVTGTVTGDTSATTVSVASRTSADPDRGGPSSSG